MMQEVLKIQVRIKEKKDIPDVLSKWGWADRSTSMVPNENVLESDFVVLCDGTKSRRSMTDRLLVGM